MFDLFLSVDCSDDVPVDALSTAAAADDALPVADGATNSISDVLDELQPSVNFPAAELRR